jgi:hypothetical protein
MRRREDGEVNHTWNGRVEIRIEQRERSAGCTMFQYHTRDKYLIEGRWRLHCIVGVEVGRLLDSIWAGIMRKNVDYKQHDGGYFVWRGDRVL